MGLNAYRDEVGAFVSALGASAASEETVLQWLDDEIAELKVCRADKALLRHQIYDVMFLLFSLAAEHDLDLEAEWEGVGREKLARYLKDRQKTE